MLGQDAKSSSGAKEAEKRKKSGGTSHAHGQNKDATGATSGSTRKRTRKPALLIRHLGGVDKRKGEWGVAYFHRVNSDAMTV